MKIERNKGDMEMPTVGDKKTTPSGNETKILGALDPKTMNGADKFWMIMLGVVVVALVIVSVLFVQALADVPDTVQVENVFVDVNEDGEIDLLLKGEVIPNSGEVNFLKKGAVTKTPPVPNK